MSRTRRTSNSSRPVVFLLLFVVLCCLGGLYYYLVMIPSQVKTMFGEADPALSALQRLQYTYRVYQQNDKLLDPSTSVAEKELFEISPNESVSSIAGRLYEKGIIGSTEAFTNYLIYKGFDRSLRSGEYYLSASLSIVEIAEKIHSSTGDRMEFATIAGWRVEEVAASQESYGFQFSAQDFLAVIKHPDRVNGINPAFQKYSSLEGFLLPGSYPVDRDVSAEELATQMVNAFDQSISQKMKKGYTKHDLSLYQAVILASIVEKESILDEEKPTIASVFYNRLASGMNLETDPTVQYALGYNEQEKTWWTNPLSAVDLQIQSPYNTYLHGGLPPGPICNPSIESLRAVAFPADTQYYYFRAACDGSGKHNFSTTLDEHIQNACP